eukprot:27322-Rhodomonas_salina.1
MMCMRIWSRTASHADASSSSSSPSSLSLRSLLSSALILSVLNACPMPIPTISPSWNPHRTTAARIRQSSGA